MIDGLQRNLEILDVPGQEEFTALRDQWIRDNDGFMLVYSIIFRDTFNELSTFLDNIKRVKCDQDYIPIVLVGNMADLEEKREVSFLEGKNFAKQEGFTFFETSALTRKNVEEAYFELVRKMEQTYPKFNYKLNYLSGNGIEKLFKTKFFDFPNCEIPSINKNLKNAWLIIFKRVFSFNKSARLNFKLVCKYWYNMVTKNFEKRKEKPRIFGLENNFFEISSLSLPEANYKIDNYFFVIDFCEYLNESPYSQRETLNKLTIDPKKILIIFLNTKTFKLEFKDKSDLKFELKQTKPNKIIEEITKIFSKWKKITFETLSIKNLVSISKKIDPKNHKKLFHYF